MRRSGTTLLRAVRSIDLCTTRAVHVWAAFRDEVVWGWTAPPKREAFNLSFFSGQRGYLPGGEWFEQGLFPWEREALTRPSFPRTGRILLGAAGGGREMLALLHSGYQVVAFDPCDPMVQGAERIASRSPGSTVVQASYADLTRGSHGQGPMAKTLRREIFDGVFLGWASLSYIPDPQARSDLFRSIRSVAPKAPILMSFYSREGLPEGRADRLRRRIRAVLGRIGAPHSAESGDRFSDRGFVHLFMRSELEGLLSATGYQIEHGAFDPYSIAYVVAMPVGGTR